MQDPHAILLRLRDLLADRGMLRVTVPNVGRIPRRRLSEGWPYDGRVTHIMSPCEHLHGFSSLSLSRLAARAGFRPLAWQRTVVTEPGYALRLAFGGWVPQISTTKLYLGTAL